jgi:hypothetical protein
MTDETIENETIEKCNLIKITRNSIFIKEST